MKELFPVDEEGEWLGALLWQKHGDFGLEGYKKLKDAGYVDEDTVSYTMLAAEMGRIEGRKFLNHLVELAKTAPKFDSSYAPDQS